MKKIETNTAYAKKFLAALNESGGKATVFRNMTTSTCGPNTNKAKSQGSTFKA